MADQTAQPKLSFVLNELKRQFLANGGWRLLVGFLLLWIYGASLMMLLIGPYELSLVYAAQKWTSVPVHVKSVELEPPPFQEGHFFWQFRFIRDDTGEELVTADVRPGDISFSALGWSTTTADAERYKPGMATHVFVAPGGHKFFIEQGDPKLMQGIIAASLLLWLWTGLRMRWRRR